MTDDQRQAAYEAWLFYRGDTRKAAETSGITPSKMFEIATHELWRCMPPKAQAATYTTKPHKP